MRGTARKTAWTAAALTGLVAATLFTAGAWAGGEDCGDDRIVSKGRMRVVVVDDDGNRHAEHYEFDEDTPRPFLGVMTAPNGEGARIDRVIDGSAAERAGLREGDVIVGFDGEPIDGPGVLTRRILGSKVGERVELELLRDGDRRTVDVELGETKGWPMELSGVDLGQLREHLGHMRESLDDLDFDFDVEAPHVFHGMIARRPKLGVQLAETTPELREHLGSTADAGVLVSRVLDGTPAEAGGVLVGDLIVGVDGEPVESVHDLIEALSDADGRTLRLELVRDRRTLSLDVTIPEPETEPQRKPSGPRA